MRLPHKMRLPHMMRLPPKMRLPHNMWLPHKLIHKIGCLTWDCLLCSGCQTTQGRLTNYSWNRRFCKAYWDSFVLHSDWGTIRNRILSLLNPIALSQCLNHELLTIYLDLKYTINWSKFMGLKYTKGEPTNVHSFGPDKDHHQIKQNFRKSLFIHMLMTSINKKIRPCWRANIANLVIKACCFLNFHLKSI